MAARRAGPPSTSTAQWRALATGASPALTGVYGDHAGAWIDENASLLCTDAKSKARVGAEEAFAAHDAVVLRLGGIYGPGRSLLDAQRRAASTSEKPVNRIHVDDIAGDDDAPCHNDGERRYAGDNGLCNNHDCNDRYELRLPQS